MTAVFLKKCCLAALAVFGVFGAFNPQAFGYLDGVNLLFHEAGHVIFGLLGPGLGIWGGTLLQLLIPGGIAAGFLQKGETFSAAACLFWFGENLIPISAYMKDSRAQVLSYVGGEIHDWGFILTRAGLVEYDQVLGSMIWGFGLILMLAACFFPMMILSKPEKKEGFERSV